MSSKNEMLVIEKDDLPEEKTGFIEISLDDLPLDDQQERLSVYPGLSHEGNVTFGSKIISFLIQSNLAQYLLAGLLGGFLGWFLMSPFTNINSETPFIQVVLITSTAFSILGALIGFFLGAVEGVVTKTWSKALRRGSVGLAFGFFGGFLGGCTGQIAYIYFMMGDESKGFVALIMSRAFSMGIVGLLVGFGQGVSYRSRKKLFNGLLGGFIGGLLGGCFFEVIMRLTDSVSLSRMIAITLIGGFVGAAIGLVDETRKEAWLKVIGGRLEGKEYILFNAITTVGSSPDCDIVIARDPHVAPLQATIKMQSGAYVITDTNPIPGTYVNGRSVSGANLSSGQNIRVGSTVLSFCLKPVRNMVEF